MSNQPLLPSSGPVEVYAQMRAVLDKRAFLAALPGAAVLIRLDERGGDDEPAPWAFHGSGLPLPVDVKSTDEDVFLDRSLERVISATAPNDPTLTGPTFPLSVPAARGRATLHVIPLREIVSVGRAVTCDVRIQERSISKNHARIHTGPLEGGGLSFAIADVGSHNGLAVNARRVAQRGQLTLLSGDVVELGDVSLLFLDGGGLWDGLPRLTDG